MTEPNKLFTFEFFGLCMVAFLAICNVSVFYNLFNYLQTLGIPTGLCGLVIGAYSLTAMVLYLLGSPFLNRTNAPRVMLLGMLLMIVSGTGYLFVHSFYGLILLRIINGAGQFCTSGGVMALFVSVIPLEKSGQAFGLYSVAILLGYAGVPAIMDALAPFIPSPPYGYAAATVSLAPAAWIVLRIRRRHGQSSRTEQRGQLPTWADISVNVFQLPVALLLLLNMSYFSNWSSLFFLFKGFAQQQGLTNVGAFFTVQMVSMIVIRLLGGRMFDVIDKVWLVGICFIIVGLGHLTLDHLPGLWAVPFVGVLFGVGMGLGYPAINGLMLQISAPHFRSLNANLMLFAVQAGFFLGPVLGGALVANWNYHGYFLASSCLAFVAAALSVALAMSSASRRFSGDGSSQVPEM
ncbi:MAG: MFS transporter [Deltaproteobacteria bacterium]|nr:MFS transporter [Deltaproteobacteria bacterium]